VIELDAEHLGWVKLHRKILDWEWYTDPNTLAVFLHLLLNANYEQKKYRGNIIDVGESLTSIQSLSEELNLSNKQIRTALEHLKSAGTVAIRRANGAAKSASIVKLCKYSIYQELGLFEGQAQGQENGTQNGNQGASKGQAKGKQRATPKEYKNNKNKRIKENKNIYGEFENIFLTEEEHNRLVEQFGANITERAINYLGSYKLEKSYKTNDDNLTIRRWVIDAVEKDPKKGLPTKQVVTAMEKPKEQPPEEEEERELTDEEWLATFDEND
jgi:hypothetical protein